MKDIVVIDIETKNTFADVGGDNFIDKLEVSLACAYSYNQDKMLSFWEEDMPALNELMKNAGLIIGFSINRFDLPVLKKHFDFNINALKRLDLLEEIEMNFGRRVGLDILAQANMGVGKTHHSLEAIRLWNEGKYDELEGYCQNDVKITKDLYELAKKQGHLLVPDRQTGGNTKVDLDLQRFIDELIASPETLF